MIATHLGPNEYTLYPQLDISSSLMPYDLILNYYLVLTFKRIIGKDYTFYFAVRLNNLKKKSLLNICEVQSGPHPVIRSLGVTESLAPFKRYRCLPGRSSRSGLYFVKRLIFKIAKVLCMV